MENEDFNIYVSEKMLVDMTEEELKELAKEYGMGLEELKKEIERE